MTTTANRFLWPTVVIAVASWSCGTSTGPAATAGPTDVAAAVAADAAVDAAPSADAAGGGDAVADSGVSADTKADAAPETAPPTDIADAMQDTDTATVADAKPPVDTAPPVDAAPGPDTAADVVPAADCAGLQAQIAALTASLQVCTSAKGCQSFEHPICGSAGCFQMPIGADADQAALTALASAAAKLGCAGFTCGCGPAPPSYCLNKKCGQCPPDCEGSCEEKGVALNQAAAAAASYCSKDEDCTVIQTGLCPVGDLPCGGIPVNKNAKLEQVQALATAYAPCGAMCKCMVPGPAKCISGKCKV